MSDVKKYGLDGIAASVELGKGGARIKDNGGVIEARNNADNALAVLRAADPVNDTDVVTKKYLESNAHVTVVGEVYDVTGTATFFPVAPFTATNIYICTQTTGTYTINRLYRWTGAAWTELIPFAGMRIVTTIALTNGTNTYSADHIYLWDADGASWVDIGPASAETKILKTVRQSLVFGSGASVNIGGTFQLPIGARSCKATVSVATPFNGTAPTLKLGDAGVTDNIMKTTEINLKVAGTYVADCYNVYAAPTQLVATYVADSSAAGAAEIEIEYSIQ